MAEIKTISSVAWGSVKVVAGIASDSIKNILNIEPGDHGGGDSAQTKTIGESNDLVPVHDPASLSYGTVGGRTGVIATGVNGWGSTGGTTAAYVTELGEDGCYIEITQTATPTGHFMFALAYADDSTASPNTYSWLDWALYCNGGKVAVWEHGSQKYSDSNAANGFIADRTWRIAVDSDGEVTYQRSDDGFSSAGTTIYTSATTCVVPRDSDGSYLAGGFSLYTASPASVVLQSVKLHGILAGT